MSLSLTAEDEQILLKTARESIAACLARRAPCFPASTPALQCHCGAFVTLKSDGRLRGCIGHITAAKPLVETVQEMALASAFEDPRFPPLRPEEWDSIRIEISALSPFEQVDDVSRIEVGVHGIMVRRGSRSGLLLPQVATEQGWDREMFLAHTCMKAGLPGDAWKSPETTIEMFSAIVFREKE